MQRTARFVAFVLCLALPLGGYDLVVQGVVLPGLLADPPRIGNPAPAAVGLLGSSASIVVLVGSLVCGATSDFCGRRQFSGGIVHSGTVYSGMLAGGVFAAGAAPSAVARAVA
ncbi:hypothetical protein [Kocuria nitroreducens]|uniref:hypothetical protein n=1 Tax=Kocuria nitroreducens TaxID=3058914 RepID=UPI0036DCF3C0